MKCEPFVSPKQKLGLSWAHVILWPR